MAKNLQQPASNDQTLTEELVGQQKPEEVLFGLEAFASAKDLHWTLRTRLILYAEQNNVTDKTFDEWEIILSQL